MKAVILLVIHDFASVNQYRGKLIFGRNSGTKRTWSVLIFPTCCRTQESLCFYRNGRFKRSNLKGRKEGKHGARQ